MLSRTPEIEIDPAKPFLGDKLNREKVASNLGAMVKTLSGPFVIALNAPWGGGKTTFIRMWKASLELDGHLCVIFNAWDSDFSEDPLLAFMAALEEQLPEERVAEAKRRLVDLGASILRRALPLALQVGTAGILRAEEIENALQLSKDTQEEIDKWVADAAKERLAAFTAERDAVEDFKVNLGTVAKACAEGDDRIAPMVVFVDEMDRCRPDFAISLLERIKHLFDVEGLVFVLALDQEQLGHSISAVYGSEFDAQGYLGRFIDLSYALPAPDHLQFASVVVGRLRLQEVLEPSELDFLIKAFAWLASGMSLRSVDQLLNRLNLIFRTTPQGFRRDFGPVLLLLTTLQAVKPVLIAGFLRGDVGADDLLTAMESLGRPGIRDTRFGHWAEAQVRLVSGVKGELSQWVAEVDSAKKAGDASERELGVREALIATRQGGHFHDLNRTVAGLIEFSEGLVFPDPPEIPGNAEGGE